MRRIQGKRIFFLSWSLTNDGCNTYLNTVNGCLFFVDDYSVDVPPKNNRDGSLVFPLGRLTQVHETPTHTCSKNERSKLYREGRQ